MGTGVTVSGVATFTTSSLTARTHTIKATYAGDATFATSSANVKQVVDRDVAATNLARSSPTPAQTTVVARAQPQAPNLGRQCATSTELFTSGSPSLIVDSVAFTAQVYLSYACKGVYGANCSSGRVYFYDGTTQIGEGTPNYESCQAAMDTSSLSLGLHRIKATFVPCCGWHPSSGRLTQVVERAPTTTAISSFPNPSSYGQDVTFTATASTNQAGPGPTGKVKFLDGETIIGTVILDQNFEATLTKKTLAAGTNSITAEYFGDGLYAKSTSPVLNQAVNPASTTTAITSSPDPSQSGQSVDFTATVSSSIGARATGTVTFTAGDTTLGTVALTGIHASIATAALPVGSTAITAAYNGSVDFSGSSASLTQTVQP
jgi:hypothetical protein